MYTQGTLNLCWTYSLLMVESYWSDDWLNDETADIRAKEIAITFNGDNWNKGVIPSMLGKKKVIDSISDLYLLLYENGPVYAY